MKLQLWDTAGQEKFRSIAKGYFKNAHGCIMVYDVNNRLTYKNLDFWMKEFTETSRLIDLVLPEKPILVLGNKTDKDENMKQISKTELDEFAQTHNVIAHEISAKKNSNKEVQNAINDFIDRLVKLSNFI